MTALCLASRRGEADGNTSAIAAGRERADVEQITCIILRQFADNVLAQFVAVARGKVRKAHTSNARRRVAAVNKF